MTVKLLVQDNRISCLETAQEGESQSRGGYEASATAGSPHDRGRASAGIDAISGATITTSAVTDAVNAGLCAFRILES